MRPPLEAWGVQSRLEPMTGGHRNTVLRTVDHSPPLVFKTTTRSEAQIAWLNPVCDAAVRAGLIVARPVAGRDGRYVQNGWTAEHLMTGRALDASDQPKLRTTISRFHRMAHGIQQRPGFTSARDLLTCERGGEVDLSVMPAGLVAQCRAAWQDVPPKHTALHGDLNAGNILVSGSGRFALFDWDEARVDHPLFDMHPIGGAEEHARAALAFEIACCWQREPEYARRLAATL